jgi:hypothetical protein
VKVIDSEDHSWFLFEHEGHLYLDANCDLNAFGYSYMIQLNEAECKSYEAEGRKYLIELAREIHSSVPITLDTASTYKGRDVSDQLSELATDAIKDWQRK